MYAIRNPNSARDDYCAVIHLQCLNSYAPYIRPANDLRPTLTPFKMVAPSVLADIEQTRHLAGSRVNRLSARTFMGVAIATGQSQIFKCCQTTGS